MITFSKHLQQVEVIIRQILIFLESQLVILFFESYNINFYLLDIQSIDQPLYFIFILGTLNHSEYPTIKMTDSHIEHFNETTKHSTVVQLSQTTATETSNNVLRIKPYRSNEMLIFLYFTILTFVLIQ